MKFKKNLHMAKRIKLDKVNKLISEYPVKFPTPKYLIFSKKMLENGWLVKWYIANRVSKYVFIIKGNDVFKIRFSNHKPLYEKEIENDCDYYVGVSHTAVHKTEEIINLFENK